MNLEAEIDSRLLAVLHYSSLEIMCMKILKKKVPVFNHTNYVVDIIILKIHRNKTEKVMHNGKNII